MDISVTANNFEDLVNNGRIEFKTVAKNRLSPFVQLVVESFLEKHELNWKLGTIIIGNSVCLKIEDEYLHYLDIYTDKQRYQWSGEGHKKGIMPDDAMKYMVERALPGAEIKILKDGSVTINDNIRIQTKT